MVKAKLDDIKKELEEEEKENYGEGRLGSSESDPEEIQSEDVEELVRDVTGQNPKSNIADEINEAEKNLQEE